MRNQFITIVLTLSLMMLQSACVHSDLTLDNMAQTTAPAVSASYGTKIYDTAGEFVKDRKQSDQNAFSFAAPIKSIDGMSLSNIYHVDGVYIAYGTANWCRSTYPR